MVNNSLLNDLNSKLADLHRIEGLLLKGGAHFDYERRRFILNKENRDLVASAGSGKTTALVAKLMMLEKEMPFDDGRGVCVLTHTNVAIDEIKAKLGRGSILLQHPNFLGTIQRFADQFFAIPAYRWQFKKSPSFIDDAYYNSAWDDSWVTLTRDAQYYCRHNSVRGFPYVIRKNYRTGELSNGLLGNPLQVSLPKRTLQEAEKVAILKSLGNARERIISRGLLSFDDSYCLAFSYLRGFPFMKNLVAKRFKFLFVDEMQDTAEHQIDLLEQIFSGTDVVIQRIGDPNQSIYKDTGGGRGLEDLWTPNRPLSFNRSLRFSSAIAAAIQGIRIDQQSPLEGNPSVPNIQPRVILFDAGKEPEVVRKFLSILSEECTALNITAQDSIKIVALNCKQSEEEGGTDNLQKYGLAYVKPPSGNSIHHPCAKMYLNSLSPQEKSFKLARALILEIASRFLFLQKVTIDAEYPSKKRILAELGDQREFKQMLFELSTSLALGLLKYERLRGFLSQDLLSLVSPDSTSLKPKAVAFLDDEPAPVASFDNVGNGYGFHNGVEIKISSVHGVKGETHKAVLYLETKYQQLDVGTGLKRLLAPNPPKVGVHESYLRKVFYVGASRPTHLLCVAAKKEQFAPEDIEALRGLGWREEVI